MCIRDSLWFSNERRLGGRCGVRGISNSWIYLWDISQFITCLTTLWYRIYCNRSLSMSKIKAIGFDMDYTLVGQSCYTIYLIGMHCLIDYRTSQVAHCIMCRLQVSWIRDFGVYPACAAPNWSWLSKGNVTTVTAMSKGHYSSFIK